MASNGSIWPDGNGPFSILATEGPSSVELVNLRTESKTSEIKYFKVTQTVLVNDIAHEMNL
jgi:hypothetical protein